MSTLPGNSTPSAGGFLGRRTQAKLSQRQARRSFWRTLKLVRPHRRRMTLGVLLGLGVALTYAGTLGGLLPVLKVITEEDRSLHQVLQAAGRPEVERAAVPQPILLDAEGAPAAPSMEALPPPPAAVIEVERPRWHERYLPYLAPLFPRGNTPQDRMNTLIILLAILLALNLIGNVLRVLSQYMILNASHRMMMDLRRRMYRKSLRVPMMSIAGNVSDRVNQFLSDTREIFLGVTTLFGKVAREPLKAIAVLVVALMLDARLTLVVVAIAPLAIVLLWYFGRKVRKAVVRLLEGYGVMLGGLEETLQGIDVVKGHAREGYERRRMWRIERGMLRQLLKLSWIEAIASPLIEIIGVLATSVGVVWLAHRTFIGEMEPARFITMVALLAAMLDPIRKIANVYNQVQRAGGAASRVWEFLDEPEERLPVRAARLRGEQPRPVTFENVTFRYTPEQEPAAVADLSLEVRPGECLAIVGPNGSGKSTLLRLLPRLIEPQAGRILIDDRDIREFSLRDLRRHIAVVTQRPVIFARTAFENIAYGKPDATLEEVRTAARQAFAAEFVEHWPEQYETVLGEYGTSISGGQRQRLAIARAFLKPASILIFDEATSEVDADSEAKIHAALHDLRAGKTTFLIAHRHTVMEMADRIVVMDAGRIVDVGTQAELLERCPLFLALYRTPAGVA